MNATLPSTMQIGLKEWDTVCRAVGSGRQIMLLRKGGVSEAGGVFEIKHREFLFFPTFIHQNKGMLKAEAHGEYAAHSSEPETLTISLAGQVTDIVAVRSREAMDRLDDLHIWAQPLIDMRFNYKPENPLYVMLVRGWRLARGVSVANTAEYAGCKSWVPLDASIETAGAEAVLGEEAYGRRRGEILERLGKGV